MTPLLLILALSTADPQPNLSVNTERPVLLVMFYSGSCEPCRRMKPALRKLSGEGFAVRCLDVADPKWKVYVDRFKVRAVPHLLMIVNGKAWQAIRGAAGETTLRQWFSDAQQMRNPLAPEVVAPLRPSPFIIVPMKEPRR